MTQLQAQKIGDALEKIANELQRLNGTLDAITKGQITDHEEGKTYRALMSAIYELKD